MHPLLKHILLLAVWSALLGGGFWRLFMYANTPGAAAFAHPQWPADTLLSRGKKIPTLLVFAHPHCPCSEASIGELERLIPHIKGKVKVFVVFFKPNNQSNDWAKERLWEKAQVIPEVNLVLDTGGAEATRFDAKTSGQAFLYDSNGTLVFNGGITPARGHGGDNLGRDSILDFVDTGKTDIPKTSVFGCALKNPERAVVGEKQ